MPLLVEFLDDEMVCRGVPDTGVSPQSCPIWLEYHLCFMPLFVKFLDDGMVYRGIPDTGISPVVTGVQYPLCGRTICDKRAMLS